MATSTINTTSSGTRRDNSILYWGIAIAILVVIAIVYAVGISDRNIGTQGPGSSVTTPATETNSGTNPGINTVPDNTSAPGTGTDSPGGR